MNPYELGVIDAHAAIATGKLTARQYIDSCIARAIATEPHVSAFAHFDGNAVLQQIGRALASGGKFAAMPIGIKDIIATAGVPTEMGAAAFKGHIPTKSAWVVEQLTAAGAVMFGKTATTEFAWRHPAKTRNPWNLSHTPGGSSSGSAAAVALGCVPAALGTQTFGSVVRPAAYCGVVGFKPSFGSIPRTGVYPLAHSLDHVGVLARSVADAAFVADALFGRDGVDFHRIERPSNIWPFNKLTAPPRIALLDTASWGDVSEEQRAAVENTARELRNAGAIIEPIALTPDFDAIWQIANTLCDAEGGSVHMDLAGEQPARVSQHILEMVGRAREVSSVAYIRAKQQQSMLAQAFTTCVSGFDAILTAPATGEAPEGLANTGDAKFCIPFSVLGVPAITLPVTFSANGLPLGIQLAADWGQDKELIETAAWVEQALGRNIQFPHVT